MTVPPQPTSIFDAIKDGDWEGLLALYATTAYDAVRSAELFSRCRRGGSGSGGGRGGFHRSNSMPLAPISSMMTMTMGGGGKKQGGGLFIEGESTMV